jgi:hypothetical protein
VNCRQPFSKTLPTSSKGGEQLVKVVSKTGAVTGQPSMFAFLIKVENKPLLYDFRIVVIVQKFAVILQSFGVSLLIQYLILFRGGFFTQESAVSYVCRNVTACS